MGFKLSWLVVLFALGSYAQPFTLRDQAFLAAVRQTASAGGAFSPTDVADLEVWLAPNTITASDGDGIQTLNDHSGNANHFGQATSGSRALFTNSTSFFGNKKSIWFDGTADWYTNLSYNTVAGNYSLFFVIRAAEDFGGFAARYLLESDANTFSVRATDAADYKASVYDSGLHTFEYLRAEPLIIEFILNSTGTSAKAFTNGVQIGSTFAWIQPAADKKFTLGVNDGRDIGFFNGAMADALIYSRALTDTERGNVRTYLANTNSITLP